MKKFIAIACTVVMLLSLAGCSHGTGAEGGASSGGSSGLFQKYESLDGYRHVPANPLRVKENVLLDEGGLTIKALWVDTEPTEPMDQHTEPGPRLELLITNATGKFLTLWLDYATINGYTVYAPFCEYSSDGISDQYTVPFNCADLLEAGLGDIAQIGLKFSIYDDTDMETPMLTTDMLYVETELSNGWVDTVNTDGALVYEDENFTIKVLGTTTKSKAYNSGNYDYSQMEQVEGPALSIYLENRSESPVWFEITGTKLNDMPLLLYLPYECKTLLPHEKMVTYADLHFRDAEAYGHMEIYDAVLQFTVYRYDDEDLDNLYDERLVVTEMVNVQF